MIRRLWCSRWTGVLLTLTLATGLLVAWGCSSGGFSWPWHPRGGTGTTPPQPGAFDSLWWIAPAGVVCGIIMAAVLGMRREGVITALASIALAVVLNWLEANMTMILLVGGAGAAAYLLGNGQERLSAFMGAMKLRREGKDAEATALMRQALPWVDAKHRRQSKRRKKSGSIKPVAKETP